MSTAGYSGTPLAKKLGIKSGYHIFLVNQPIHYFSLFSDFPENVVIEAIPAEESLDLIHVFVQTQSDLEAKMNVLKPKLKKNGVMWVSWPKGSSDLKTDINREDVRKHVLDCGLVDVKVCAVDNDWSGLKFMYRKADR